MENKKLTKLEKYWIMYDVGNSAFVMLIATIIPIYFNYLAKTAGISEVDYLAYWGVCSVCIYDYRSIYRTGSWLGGGYAKL